MLNLKILVNSYIGPSVYGDQYTMMGDEQTAMIS